MNLNFSQTPEEIADELIAKFQPLAEIWDYYYDIPSHLKNEVKCAIIAVELALSVCFDSILTEMGYFTNPDYTKLQEVLTILKSKE